MQFDFNMSFQHPTSMKIMSISTFKKKVLSNQALPLISKSSFKLISYVHYLKEEKKILQYMTFRIVNAHEFIHKPTFHPKN